MLEEMRIRGLGVIDDATLELGPGLTVVTGETGAGKTMVITGLHLLFGGRADAARVRVGAGQALVEGRLRLPDRSPALARLAEVGAEPDDDGAYIASRTVSEQGRSRAYVGGRSVPVGLLAELADGLLAVHGQSDQLRLLRPAEQRGALDRYAGEPVTALVAGHKVAYARWRELAARYDDRVARARELAQEADLLRQGLAEIAAVDPRPGEDVELAAEADRLAHADALRLAAQIAHDVLVGDPTAGHDAVDVAALLGAARHALDGAAANDPALAGPAARLTEAAYQLTDVAAELSSYVAGLDADPGRLAEVEQRRSELLRLTRRYADDVAGVLAWGREADARLAALDTSEEALARLAEERDQMAAELAGITAKLSAARREAAARFGTAVTAELAGLAMPQAAVRVRLSDRPVGPDGADEVELLLRAHPDAPALPLGKGASGGELSRVMLAVEVVFAGADPVPVLVFDEVDAGVGGRAAVEVGRRLARLATDHQVLVVTHLAQVAGYADAHLVVDKAGERGVTRSDVRLVDQPGRVRELARMLAGDMVDASDQASQLLVAASRDKQADQRRTGSRPRPGGT
ncbi:MAG TPA: DNA repair protein RecN [Mycobacteriales bacterium]|nr:DNA repair protein RecN [Mycobacteriales bacterium]